VIQIEVHCGVLFGVTLVCCLAPQQLQACEGFGYCGRRRIYLDGEAIAASQIIVKDGVSYMDTALPSLWRSVRWCNRGERGLVIISPPKPSIEGEKAIAEGQHFSEQFRKAVSGVAD
jgi:hypothetical protein